jgi:16S rRNA processing protein RimM
MNSENSNEIPSKSDLHKIGFFPRLHGYKGELTATLDTLNNKDYVHLELIYVEVKGTLVPFKVLLIEYKTNSTMKVKLEGIDSEELAKGLLKCSFYIDPEDLSEEDGEKQALRAIVGFKVIDDEKGEIGKVKAIEEHPNNPLFIIQSGTKEILLPLNQDFFQKIDRRKKEVHISAPGGLIDFYLEQ